MVEPLRHRQTKGAETDMPGLPPPRHIPTLPTAAAFRTISDGPPSTQSSLCLFLFDDFVGTGEDRWRDCKAEPLGGLEIDDQLERRRLLDRQIGGLDAVEDPSRVNADPAIYASQTTRSITDQPAGQGVLAQLIDRRNGIARCSLHELVAPAIEEWLGGDEERAGTQFDQGGESGVDLAFGAGSQDMELQPLRAHRFLHVSNELLSSRIHRIHQQGNHPGLGNQLGEQLEAFGRQVAGENTEAGEVATRSRQTSDEAGADRVADAGENDRDCRGRVLRRECRREAAACNDQIDLAVDKMGGHRGQPIIATLGPAVFDRNVLPLDVAGFAQSLTERGDCQCSWLGRAAVKEADNRHRLLLRTGQERICRRAGENRYEIPAPHPQPLDPTLGMDYASTEPLSKGWTMSPFHPVRSILAAISDVGFSGDTCRSPVHEKGTRFDPNATSDADRHSALG